jgi:hypothetical protein
MSAMAMLYLMHNPAKVSVGSMFRRNAVIPTLLFLLEEEEEEEEEDILCVF